MTSSARRALVSIVALALLALAGCSADSSVAEDQAGGQGPDGEWWLASFADASGSVTLPERQLVLRVDGRELGGNGGCNSFGGDVEFAASGSAELTDLSMTLMACEEQELMVFEDVYTRALLGIDQWSRNGDVLELRGPDVVLTYVPRIVPETPLFGTSWTFDTLYNGPTASNSVDMRFVSLTLTGDAARVEGQCWTIDAPAAIEAGQRGNLAIDLANVEPAFTCDDRELLETVVEGLNAVDAYEVDENRLTLLSAGEPVLGFSA